MTNFDILGWVDKLGITDFRGVYSRDNLPNKQQKNECGVLNLDDSIGEGTHWVCWDFRDKRDIYFDSYGLPPPQEFINYINAPYQYNTIQYQHKLSFLCGYFCLFFLHQAQTTDKYQILYHYLSPTNRIKNELVLNEFFKNENLLRKRKTIHRVPLSKG